MMAFMEQRARALDQHEMTLKAQKAIPAACRFFTRLGYRQIDDEGAYILFGKSIGEDPTKTSP